MPNKNLSQKSGNRVQQVENSLSWIEDKVEELDQSVKDNEKS
jgi:hypothetical protein